MSRAKLLPTLLVWTLICTNFIEITSIDVTKSTGKYAFDSDESVVETCSETFSSCLDNANFDSKLKIGDSKSGPDLIRANGFPLEVHAVPSPTDGYVTSLYRIPRGRSNIMFQDGPPKKVAIFHHGIIADGFSWVLNSVDKALAYRLAEEADVDVWLIHTRGTYYSLDHTSYSWTSNQYWNFSFHEIGVNDVPAIIDYVLYVSGQESLYYISHSMGCAAFVVAMSTFPEYNAKVRTFIGLAPSVYVGNTSAPFIEPLIPLVLKQQEIYDSIHLSQPFVSPIVMPFMPVVGNICSNRFTINWICFAVLETIFGYDFEETNYDMSGEIMRNALSSASMKSLFHLFQLWKSGDFRQYDYQERRNMEIYGTPVPPIYDLSKVTSPVVLYCGEEDNLVSCHDVYKMKQKLANVKEFKKISWPKFNHIDFLFATNINSLLNNRIVAIVKADEFYAQHGEK
ncbi:lipase 3 [Folsomia candida]|uniref:lipase 3 n=1 Tax=Folsomia candida TaxID=158441 RepID=UPI000B8F7464|nr:lipase 3 [Folsomia candida]